MRGHSISVKVKTVEYFFNNIYNSILSCLKIFILSKYKITLPKAAQDECIVLGNGPSLKQSLSKKSTFFREKSLICVNNFATANEFFELKPGCYVLLDPGFFIYKTRPDVFRTFNILKNEVNWELNLFVPYSNRKDPDIQSLLIKKTFVKVYFYNYVVFKGFDFLAFSFYRKNLAMPQFNNVLGPSIMLGINMGYKKVNLAGADHSWFENIVVTDDNSLCQTDRHFYDKGNELPLVKIADPVSKKEQRIADFFNSLYKVFNSYYIVNRYALTRKCSIYNISDFSYIDAFERKKIF